MTICEAIAREEGFLVVGSRSQRNNNPGDIEYGTFAKSHGADGIELVGPHLIPRFAHFPDITTGYAAMRELLLIAYKGLDIAAMLDKYAPPIENQTNNYIVNVCTWTGLTPSTIIDDYL